MIQAFKATAVRLLRWSEPYTRLDMVYLASGGFWIAFGQVASNVMSLGLLVAFANLLPPDTYGMYRYILSLAGILSIFSLTGMNSAVARAVAVGEDGALRHSVRYQLQWNAIMLAAFVALAGYYLYKGDELFATAFFVLGVFVPATLAFNTYGSYLEGKKAFRMASIASILSTFVYSAGMFAALLWGADVLWLVAVYAGTTLVSTLFFYLLTLRLFHPPAASSGDTLAYGRKLTFIGLIGPIAAQADKIILVQFWGTAELAAYALATAIPDKGTALLKNWVGIGAPKFAQKSLAELNRVFYARVLQGMALGAACFVAYLFLSPFLFTYILPQYIDSLLYSQIAALAFLFAVPNRYVSLLLVSQQLSAAMFWNNLTQSLVRIGLYVVLGIWGGILGLVLALVAMACLGMLVNIGVWRKASRA